MRNLLQVKVKPSRVAPQSRWANENLDPLQSKDCTWRERDFLSYWATDLYALPLWTTISTVMTMGFSAKETIPITFIGFGLCGFVIYGTSGIGAKYKISYPVAARASFGMWGSLFAVAARCFVAIMWLAILTAQGGQILQVMIAAIWPSYNNLHNSLPASANITSVGLLSFFLYWMLQSGLSYLSMRRLRYLFIFKAIIVPPTFMALFIWGCVITHGNGPLINGPLQFTYTHGRAFGWIKGISAVASLFSSLSVNMPDFGRYSAKANCGKSQLVALPLFGTLAALAPVFATAAGQKLWGEIIWDFPTLLSRFDSRAARFFCGFSFLLATVANQIAADSVPFNNDAMAIWPKHIDRKRANTFATIFAFAVTPWNIIKNGQNFIAFLGGYGSYTSCLAALLCADYYIVKRQRLSIADLYKSQGSIYWYDAGVNWRAFMAFACGFIPSLPGFIQSVNPNINVGTGWVVFQFAWMYGTVVTAAVYVLLCHTFPHPQSTLSADGWQEKHMHDEEVDIVESEEKDSKIDAGQTTSISNYLA